MLTVLLALLTAHADDGVCLSDGQSLTGAVTTFDTHLALALPAGEVRVPLAAVGEHCPRELTWRVSKPGTFRRFTLTNGEQLLGAPRTLGNTVYLRLLDDQEVVMGRESILGWEPTAPREFTQQGASSTPRVSTRPSHLGEVGVAVAITTAFVAFVAVGLVVSNENPRSVGIMSSG
ncbi:MAG: hypothetical protein EP330_11585 [Deltaproteobacteria bacterium]|nr:MAG: hypothetical protein EP330_11585 [Deltaproteobacteria bacterium]